MDLIQFVSFEDGLKLVKLRGEAMQVVICNWLTVIVSSS
jgi:malonyl CoA-acyl carrier protein transacylase